MRSIWHPAHCRECRFASSFEGSMRMGIAFSGSNPACAHRISVTARGRVVLARGVSQFDFEILQRENGPRVLACPSHAGVRKRRLPVKRLIPLLAVLLFAAPSFALDEANRNDRTDRARRTVIVVDDVIRMAQAGVGGDAIIGYVRNTREPFDVSGDDLIAMTHAQ